MRKIDEALESGFATIHVHIFVAVFDGVTSKAANIPSGLKPGGIVAHEMSEGLHQLESNASCSESLSYLSGIVRSFLQKNVSLKLAGALIRLLFGTKASFFALSTKIVCKIISNQISA